jgi:hypothetical protein
MLLVFFVVFFLYRYDTVDEVDLTVGQGLDESNWPGTT